MYLRSIRLKNTGPIQELTITLPFDGGRPKPVVLVGRNGSGKSTLISFIVNALVGMKQHVYEDVEVEKGKVYRIRSPLGIYGDAHFYFARLEFDRAVSLVEWQLDKPKLQFSAEDGLEQIDPSYHQIPQNEISYYSLPLGELNQPHLLEEMLEKTEFLFFPADRFEPPDWLNSENLSSELKLPEPSRIKGRTTRRIFSRNRLKPTLDWLNSVIFDIYVSEHRPISMPVGPDGPQIPARVAFPGKGHAVFNSIVAVLTRVLCHNASDQLQLHIGDRRSRIISATITRDGQPVRSIKDLTSMSAGESSLFCLFASIVRDADLSSMTFQKPEEICGIVVIDEADLHLHVGLQFEVLPGLIALFPRVQFVMSVHAPMVSLGLERVLGIDGFEIREMPDGRQITPETYSEFKSAFEVISTTRRFQDEIVKKVSAAPHAALLVEGKTDAALLLTAWSKLYPGTQMPFEPIPCGIEPTNDERNGGADVLRRCVEFLAIVSDRPIVAIFDNDRSGNEQFGGLNAKSFGVGIDASHRKHKTKAIHCILLPAPADREDFVASTKPANRYLSIEHYFSNDVLKSNGFVLEPVVTGTTVFEIDANSKVKVAFADASIAIDSAEFKNFSLIFDRLKAIGVGILQNSDAAPE